MAIAPVSSISFRNNTSVNFGSRHNNDSEGQEYTPSQRKGVTDLGKMPVVVLLAMTPALSEAKMPENHSAGIIPPATEVIYEDPEENEDNFLIYMPKMSNTEQTRSPYGWKSLEGLHINYAKKFKAGGHEYNMLFTSNHNDSEVNEIFIFDVNSNGTKHIAQDPPMVKQVVYHNIGKDKEFCGVILERDILEQESGKYKGTIRSEMRLPDDVAQDIVDLITNYSKFQDKTNVKIKEVNTANLLPTKLYE